MISGGSPRGSDIARVAGVIGDVEAVCESSTVATLLGTSWMVNRSKGTWRKGDDVVLYITIFEFLSP